MQKRSVKAMLLAVVTMLVVSVGVVPTISNNTQPTIVEAAKTKKKSKKITAKTATTNKKLAKYLKKTESAGYYVRKVTTVSGVPTIVVNDVTSLDKPVYYEYLAQLLGQAKKTPKSAKGIGIVQQNKYRDSSGKTKKLMEFGFFFSSDELKKLSFSDWQHMVYKQPSQFYDDATGYYLMGQFVKDAKKRLPNSNLMKYDDKNVVTTYMDKFGV
jgi:hypothetical protein